MIRRCGVEVADLVSQRVGARVAQTEVAARQDERVPYVAHADDALRSVVLRVLVPASLQERSKRRLFERDSVGYMLSTVMEVKVLHYLYVIIIFVFDSINLLKQIA
jgi:hypothetical protein